MESEIPIVDINNIGIDKETYEESEAKIIGQQIIDAFTKIGFVYLLNTGISSAQVEKVNKEAWEFFSLPLETKLKYETIGHVTQGYAPIDTQSFASEKRLTELRETFNFQDGIGMAILDEIPKLGKVINESVPIFKKLSYRLLKVVELGLDFKSGFLISKHKDMCSENNKTCLRIAHYPPILKDDVTSENSVRVSAHSDFGTFTLLLQDSVGGLEVQNRNGEWIAAKPIEGAILVIVSDLLQRWTSDKLKSTMHQVPIPDNDIQRKKSRQSLVFFVIPDNDVMVEPFENSKGYEPINAGEYISNRFKDMYV